MLTLRNFQLVLLTVLLVAVGFGQTHAASYYVRITGDDDSSGTSSSTAVRTIHRAATLAGAGDSIYVGAGTYAEDIEFDGIQQTTTDTSILADTSGSYTGDAGSVIVEGRIRVTNCNRLTFDGFNFQGTATRFLVWRGSYEGTVVNCQFDAGDEGLLIGDGSLTIDTCLIQNFSHDGIQLDGEAELTILGSTISGCLESGIEVRKVAHLILEDSTISTCSEDGVMVAVDVGAIQDSTSDPLVIALDDLSLTGALIDSYNSTSGPYSSPPGTDNATVCVNDDISVNSSSDIYGSVYIEPGESVNPAPVSGSIITRNTPIACASIDPGNAATTNNNGSIPLSDLGNNPLDLSDNFTLVAGDGIDLPPGTYYFASLSLSSGSQLRISGLTTIYSTGIISLDSTTIVNSVPYNLQLYPLGLSCDLTGSTSFTGAIYGPSAAISLTGTAVVQGIVVGNDITLATGTAIHADEALLGLAAALRTNGTPIPSNAAFPVGWLPLTASELTLTTCVLDDNGEEGVDLQDDVALTADSTQFQNNAGWGAKLLGACTLTDCTFSDNDAGGLWMTDVAAADAQFTNVTLTDNAPYGLFAVNCDLTIAAVDNWAVTGSDIAFSATQGTLTLDGVTVDGSTNANVYANLATLTVQNATLSNGAYGVAAVQCTVLVEDSTITQNVIGIFSDQNDSATIHNCTIQDSTSWAATINASGTYGANVTIDGCTIANNLAGVSLTDAEDGDFTLLNTVIRDSAQTGIHFHNCILTINDQVSTVWQSLRNLYGISASLSTLSFDHLSVDEATSYGVHCHDSDITLTNSTITGHSGLILSGTSSATVDATRFSANVSAVVNWGLYRSQGDLTVTNCVFDGFESSVYLATTDVTDQATISNSTFIATTGYGVYINSGNATLTNSILSASGGQYGIAVLGGTLLHVHNLLHGFLTFYSGTPEDATELLKSPRFVDAANGDYHLAAGSPAINAGTDLSGPVPADFDGNTRPSFGVFEMGAYEFTNSAGSYRVKDWQEIE